MYTADEAAKKTKTKIKQTLQTVPCIALVNQTPQSSLSELVNHKVIRFHLFPSHSDSEGHFGD